MGLCNEVVRWIYPPTVLDSDFRRRFALLSAAMRSLPLGTAYTIWTGKGAVGSFVAGLYFLGEPATPMSTLAAVVIVAGLIMMKLAS